MLGVVGRIKGQERSGMEEGIVPKEMVQGEVNSITDCQSSIHECMRLSGDPALSREENASFTNNLWQVQARFHSFSQGQD